VDPEFAPYIITAYELHLRREGGERWGPDDLTDGEWICNLALVKAYNNARNTRDKELTAEAEFRDQQWKQQHPFS
jgi:hypothetical protein